MSDWKTGVDAMGPLAGQKFGKLTVIGFRKPFYRTPGNDTSGINGHSVLCTCQCGINRRVRESDLKHGNSKSCGSGQCSSRFVDLTGKKFGKLTVIRPSKQDKKGQWYWVCKCECGVEREISLSNLTAGKIKSCGCIKGEFQKIIHQRRRLMNVDYETAKEAELTRQEIEAILDLPTSASSYPVDVDKQKESQPAELPPWVR